MRELPEADLSALFAVLATVHAMVDTDALPDAATGRLTARLAGTGLVPAGASKDQVNKLLAGLAKRVYRALDPEPATAHRLSVPAGTAAALVAELVALRCHRVETRPAPESDRMWTVTVAFGEQPPEPGFWARQAQLTELCARHGGRYGPVT